MEVCTEAHVSVALQYPWMCDTVGRDSGNPTVSRAIIEHVRYIQYMRA